MVLTFEFVPFAAALWWLQVAGEHHAELQSQNR